jgi:hypothetical protein
MKTKMTVAIILSIAILSCKKEGDKKATCRIVTITTSESGGNSIFNVTYNNEGRISTLSSSGSNFSNKVFTYNGNTVIANASNDDGSFGSRDSITLDAKRKPLNIRKYFDEDLSNFANFSFEYNGDDLLKVNQTSETGGVPETSVATYVNGNMVSLQSPSGISTLEYFTDKKVQPGDYLELSSFIEYGVSVYPHKNLVKTIANGSSILNFNYEFNADGTISKVTATSGTTVSTVTYQYQCN